MTIGSISRIRNIRQSCDLWDVDLAAGTLSTCLSFVDWDSHYQQAITFPLTKEKII